MKIDRNSQTWGFIAAHATQRIEALRDRLESDMTENETIKVRAQIREQRAILALAEPEIPLVADENYLPE